LSRLRGELFMRFRVIRPFRVCPVLRFEMFYRTDCRFTLWHEFLSASPLLLLPPELWQHVFSTLNVRGLSRAARASQAWRGLAKPMLDEFEVAYVVERMVVDIEGGWWPARLARPTVLGPLSDSGSDDDDYDMWYGQDLDDREPDGECIGCEAVGVAGGQCLSCGAPVEPWDGSFHYDFGWVDGPRVDEPE